MAHLPPPDHAQLAYDAFAPFYDAFTAHHDYDGWVDRLERLAVDHGLAGRRTLDVGCGTGKSSAPFLARGYRVTACDGSAAMLARAARRLGGDAALQQRDLRALGRLGTFDLVTCLDDALNYLVSRDELVAALRGIAAQLDPDGLALFDVNTLATYRGFFAAPAVVETASHMLVWVGRASTAFAPGELARATFDAFALGTQKIPHVRSHHLQRHHPDRAVAAALSAAGLELVARRGQDLAGVLREDVDEERDTKVIYLARRAA